MLNKRVLHCFPNKTTYYVSLRIHSYLSASWHFHHQKDIRPTPCKAPSFRRLCTRIVSRVSEFIFVECKDVNQQHRTAMNLPVGPRNRKLPNVLSGACKRVLANRTQLLTAANAASCPTTRSRSRSSSWRSLRDSLKTRNIKVSGLFCHESAGRLTHCTWYNLPSSNAGDGNTSVTSNNCGNSIRRDKVREHLMLMTTTARWC